MKNDTIELLKELVRCEVEIKRQRMMDCINNKFDAYLKDRIAEYRRVYDARDDFYEWLETQEEGK